MSQSDSKYKDKASPKVYKTVDEFYPYYLSEHANRTNRRLHFIGTTLVMFITLIAVLTGNLKLMIYTPLVGYGFAWIGHFFFERNKPATFQYPLFSFICDFKMWGGMAFGKLSF